MQKLSQKSMEAHLYKSSAHKMISCKLSVASTHLSNKKNKKLTVEVKFSKKKFSLFSLMIVGTG